jgi:hypothetical protein
MGTVPPRPRVEHVEDKIRKKIRKGEFVDFKLLTPRPRGEKRHKKFALTDGFLEEVEDTTNPTFYKWLDAFVVFMSIHIEYHPRDAQGLLRHLQIVKRMYTLGKAAVEYDYQFRRLKSVNQDVVWGENITELALEIGDTRPAPRKPVEKSKYSALERRKLCRTFNSTKGCTFGAKCRYMHRCYKCRSQDHPGSRCNKK